MTRKTVLVVAVATLVIGTPAALVGGATSGAVPTGTDAAPTVAEDVAAAESDGAAAQEATPGENETATDENETTAADGEETTAADGEETTAADGEETTATDEEPASVTFLNQTAGITYDDATPQNTTVMVERAVLPEGGFVVIHAAENVSGEYQQAENVSVGPVLGNSTYLDPGDHANVVIQLDRPLNGSQTLVAMAHRDTDDDRQYDFPEADGPYTYLGSPVVESGYAIVVDAEGDVVTDGETDGDATTTEDEETGDGEATDEDGETTAEDGE